MSTNNQGRMLLSHNFDVSSGMVPALSREEFAAVFQVGLSQYEALQSRLVDHPHWVVEILFPMPSFSPQQVGELCAQALAQRRAQQIGSSVLPENLSGNLSENLPEILVLGGLKTTPPTSAAPDALQPGEWGVDVVETLSGEAFLQTIGWETTIAQKPADSVFKVERKRP